MRELRSRGTRIRTRAPPPRDSDPHQIRHSRDPVEKGVLQGVDDGGPLGEQPLDIHPLDYGSQGPPPGAPRRAGHDDFVEGERLSRQAEVQDKPSCRRPRSPRS